MIRKKLTNESEPDQEGAKPGQTLGRKVISTEEVPGDVSGSNEEVRRISGPGQTSDITAGDLSTNGPSIGDTAQLGGEIVQIFGKDNISSIQQAFGRLNILPGNDEDGPASWLTHIFDSYFTKKQIEDLCGYYNGFKNREQQQKEKTQQNMETLLRDVSGLQEQLGSMENSRKAQEEALVEVQRKLKAALPAPTVAQWLCNELPSKFAGLKPLLVDEAGDESSLKCRFIIRLLPTLWELEGILSDDQNRENEEYRARIEAALMKVLAAIAGLHIVNRREVLDAIGKVCSGNKDNWVFVSPESSLVVDPSIHNAKALSGTTVKEGISFAIIRKDTRQTIKLADITVI